MISKKPITMPIPATIPTRISCPSTGVAAAQQLAGAVVAPAVLEVGHQLDDHAR